MGDKFASIQDKLPYDEYSRMIREEMDILVLAHLAQAGLGHLYMFLSLGKPVYIRRETPVFGFMSQLNIEVRATNDIPAMSFEEFRKPLTYQSAKRNIQNFNRYLSTEASVESCRHLIRLLRGGHE